MLGLLVQHVREVHREARLHDADQEQVREAAHVEPLERRRPVGPLLRHRLPAAAVHLVAGTAGVLRADLEAGGVDQAIEVEVLAVGPHASLVDALHAPALGVHQRHVGPVERGQVVVVEARPLAELAVPRLQRLGHHRVLHDLLHPGADLLHLVEVGQFDRGGQALRAGVALPVAHPDQQVADDVGPAVAHQVLRLGDAADQVVEVVHPPLLPAGLQRRRPLRVGGPVVAHVDAARRALEHVEVLCRRAEVGHALHRGGAGADDADHLVRQPVQPARAVAAGVLVVPPAGVERVAGVALDAGDARQLGPVQRPVGHHQEAGAHAVATVGGDDPAALAVVPRHVGDLGGQAGVVVQAEVAGDVAAVLQDLRRVRVLALRDVADLLQQRQVDVALHVAGRTRVAVPVPRAAEVAALLDQADVLEPGLAQPGAHQQAAEATTDDGHLHLVEQRRPLGNRHVRVVEVVGELPDHLHVLLVAVGAEPLVALLAVLLPQDGGLVACGRHPDSVPACRTAGRAEPTVPAGRGRMP